MSVSLERKIGRWYFWPQALKNGWFSRLRKVTIEAPSCASASASSAWQDCSGVYFKLNHFFKRLCVNCDCTEFVSDHCQWNIETNRFHFILSFICYNFHFLRQREGISHCSVCMPEWYLVIYSCFFSFFVAQSVFRMILYEFCYCIVQRKKVNTKHSACDW